MLAPVNSNLRLLSGSNALFNARMDVSTVRRENLRLLEAKFGTLVALGEAVGTDAAVLSQIKNEYRNMGSIIARRIEKAMGKNKGWMDLPQYEDDEAIGAAIKIARRLPKTDRDAWLRHGAALVRELGDGDDRPEEDGIGPIDVPGGSRPQ